MNLTKVAFNYKKSLFTLLALFLIYGVIAYFTLPKQEDPTTIVREAVITTNFSGMSPSRVERLITKIVEKEIRKIGEVEKITSMSITGKSIIHVKVYDKYFDLADIWQDVRNKVDEAATKLPEGTQTPNVNTSFGDVAVITFAMTSDGYDMTQMNDVAEHISDSLYTVVGTKKVSILGIQEERIYLEASSVKLAQLGISAQMLAEQLQSQNVINSGGSIDTGAQKLLIEPSGNFESVEEIGNTHISIPGATNTIALKDIVNVRKGYVEPAYQPAYYNGESAVLFAISIFDNYNVLDYSIDVKAKMTSIENTLPIGYNIEVATDQSEQVKEKINNVSGNVLQTLIIVLLVVILFLGMRTGLIVGSIVPFVMLVTLAIMKATGMVLEQLSLSTLIIALGLLVDNGIVIAEDFKTRLEQGKERYQAMITCGKELAMPLLSSSLTTILFFLPLMLAENIAGEFTRSISLVILITLLSSWVMALTVTPILCYFFIKVDNKQQLGNDKVAVHQTVHPTTLTDRFYQGYEQLLQLLLAKKMVFMVIMLALFVFSMSGMKFVSQQFFPDSDRSQIMMYIDLPVGTSANETDKQLKTLFPWLNNKKQFPEIQSFSGYSGFNGPRFVAALNPEDPEENKGFIIINVKKSVDLDAMVKKLRLGLNDGFPTISGRVKRMFAGPSDSSVITIQVKGPDEDKLYAKAEEIMSVLRQVPNTINVRTDWENRTAKINVNIDQHRARRVGITTSDIASALEGYFDGTTVTYYRRGDNTIPVVLQASIDERSNLDRLRTVGVYSQSLDSVIPLIQVADFEPVNQYAKIMRQDMFKTISIKASNTEMTAQDLQLIIDDQIQLFKVDLPTNHLIEYDGVTKQSADAQQALAKNIPMVIGAVILLLILQFNSFRRASIIVITIPFSMIGAVTGLLIMDAPFGFMATLGVYSLAGIIINNSIVLIDRIKVEIKQGQTDYQAIINASLSRLRPIVMTTITTIMGLLPLILTQDPMFYGMACVIAFGLAIGTVLTLGIVPVLYASFYKVQK
jgi:multidrug efflux pump subunit AcrB